MRAITLAIVLPLTGIGTAHSAEHIFSGDFDPARLNDTGITFCGTYPSGNGLCDPSSIQGQDALYGRDALAAAGQLQKIGGGDAAFDFTKIANNGSELPANAVLGDAPDQWACTRDNVTGLMWEVKTNDPASRRYQGYTYTWYDPDSPDGNPGDSGVPTTCGGTLGIGVGCNTLTYVVRMNSLQLCGFSDWRMPTLKELMGIVDYGYYEDVGSGMIDPLYFPFTPSELYWTGSAAPQNTLSAWVVPFLSSAHTWNGWKRGKTLANHVRLIRQASP